ncbi:hypothetical protein IFM89_029725 [Coptis chinensis]|uniref:DNA replication licensing factor MCM5 n=1 Tax=Coptis chinensis TaxID=261450 RepID=A0A835LC48_9MAGN|nr:hypothetical protein IFM89_029725 [Coptis chinensis]
MSGWDEGAVYYSEQQFPHGVENNNDISSDSSKTSRHTILRKLKEFIRNYEEETRPNVFPYRESLLQNPTHLLVHFDHLQSFESHSDLLVPLFQSSPSDYLPLFETAAAEVLAALKSKVTGETGDMEEPVPSEVQILLTSKQDPLSMRQLGAQWISKLVKVTGITIAASRTKAKATYVTLICKNCKNTTGEEPCPLDPWIVVPDRSKYVDQQTLKLQENPEDVPTGELPRNILLSVDRHLVQTIVPGTRLTVMGIYSIYQASNSAAAQKGAVKVEEFKKFASEELPDGVRLRGDINVLLLGDPSTAKSQFLKFVEKTAPIAVYTSGKGSSAAGLTASVIRDNSSREFYLEGGAMVLADGGVVCIDEFDKMRSEDRLFWSVSATHKTLSFQSVQDNIDLQTTILSRFDLIFIVKDVRMYSQDKLIASHVIKVHSTPHASSRDIRDPKEEDWLKSTVEPKSILGCQTLQQPCYRTTTSKIRQDMRQQANESGESAVIPITVRQLEAIIRLSESLAKMRMSHVATEGHVLEALRLFNVSTLDAARSGISQHLNMTTEMANEIKQAETQIKRRMGIGSHISERRLIDDLSRIGLNESIVRRALLIMHQRDEVEYKRERRVILRKA